jgi:SAM-dependent methyltransferase
MTLSEAGNHAQLGLPVPTGTPQRSLKRLVAKLSWFFLHHQVAYNTEVLNTLSTEVLSQAGLAGRLDAQQARLDVQQARLDTLDSLRGAMAAELERLGADVWAAIAAQTEHLEAQNEAQNADVWAAIAGQTEHLEAQNADLWKAIAAQTDRLDGQSADLWEATTAQTTRLDLLAADLWTAVGAETDQLEALGHDLWESVHQMWAAIGDNRETLDHEQVALRIHVDLMQRQAFTRLHEGIGKLRTELVDMSLRFGEVDKNLVALSAETRSHVGEVDSRLEAEVSAQVADIHRRFEAVSAETRRRQGSVDALLDMVRRSLPEPTPREIEALPDALSGMYSDFEDVFRKSVPELFKEYLPDVLALERHGPVLDLGSGRGEWLEILKEAGIDAYGVDLNNDFIDQSLARGLKVVLADASAHLAEVPERSLSAITAFHFVEHVPVDRLIQLIDLSVRALQPGGLLVLETPNPENLIVGASSFYLDPSHLRPLPPELLRFLVEARGFAEVETRLLHPRSASQLSTPPDTAPWSSDLSPLVNLLNDRLNGPQDYAVIGRRL